MGYLIALGLTMVGLLFLAISLHITVDFDEPDHDCHLSPDDSCDHPSHKRKGAPEP